MAATTKDPFASILSVIGERHTVKWAKNYRSSFDRCLRNGGLPESFRPASGTIKWYIDSEPGLLDWFVDVTTLDDRRRDNVIGLLDCGFRERFDKSPYTNDAIGEMEKLGIDYGKLSDSSLVYGSDSLLPYGRTLRENVLARLDKSSSFGMNRLSLGKYFADPDVYVDDVVDMHPYDAARLANELGITDGFIDNAGGPLLEFRVWERDPKRDIYLGDMADTCIAVGCNNFGRLLMFLEDPGTLFVRISADKKPVGYCRVFPSHHSGDTMLYMDYYDISIGSDYYGKFGVIKEYLTSMLMEHGKKSGFGWLCSGGYKLHFQGRHNILAAHKERAGAANQRMRKFGTPYEELVGDAIMGNFPEVNYMIRLS